MCPTFYRLRQPLWAVPPCSLVSLAGEVIRVVSNFCRKIDLTFGYAMTCEALGLQFKHSKKDDQIISASTMNDLWTSFNAINKPFLFFLQRLLCLFTTRIQRLANTILAFCMLACALSDLQMTSVERLHKTTFLQQFFHLATTKLCTKWRKRGNIKFKLAHILMFALVLCAQLYTSGILAIVNYGAKNTATSSTTCCMAIALVSFCSFPLSEAYPIQHDQSTFTHRGQLHLRDSSPVDSILTLRLTGGPNVGYCLTVALGSRPQEVS